MCLSPRVRANDRTLVIAAMDALVGAELAQWTASAAGVGRLKLATGEIYV